MNYGINRRSWKSGTTAANKDLGAPPEAEGWRDVLQLLKGQSKKTKYPEDRLHKKEKDGDSRTYAAATRGQTPQKDGEWQLVEKKKKKR